MRFIVLLAIAPLFVRAQYPNRPAARAPGEFSRGLPVQAHSAARPPVGPAPLGSRSLGPGFLNGTGFIGRNSNNGGAHSHSSGSSGRRDRRSVPFGYYFAPYYSFGDYGSGFYDAPPSAPPEDPNMSTGADVTANLLGEQIQRLSAQVEQLKSEQQPVPPTYTSQAPQEAPPVAPITVVLRDGQQLQVASYAVMDRVFWDFSKQPARRIAVADIDVAASTKATEAAGAEFPELTAGR
jgi:hypothetical protein